MKINPKYLPSKRFVISLFVAIAIIIVAIVFTFFSESIYSSKKKVLPTIATSTLEAFKQADTDGDGLPDWQETLYGTDPKKADTDGDGTPDEEELKSGRDPIKANTAKAGLTPNDKIDPQIIEQTKKAEAEFENLNDTEKFARSFLSQYFATQPTDRKLTEEELNSIAGQMVSKIEPDSFKDKYTEADIKTMTNPDVKKLSNYVIAISNILTKEITKNMTLSINIANSSSESDGYSNLKKLDPIINLFYSSADKIIKMESPEDVANYHLIIANDVYKLAELLKYVAQLNKDPLKSIKGLQGYKITYEDAMENYKKMADRVLYDMKSF